VKVSFLSLKTVSFRNLADNEVITAAKDIFLVGENGQGKTNFLEALYFCSYASSFRGVKDNNLASNGESSFSVSAKLGQLQPMLPQLPTSQENTFFSDSIIVKVEKSQKSILWEGKKISDRKDLLDIISLVVFCHEDMEFVSGSQERRRWFFDQTQSMYDPVYLDDLRRYRRVLKTRNTVLKDAKTGGDYRKAAELLDALDPQLVEYGARLMEKRAAAAEQFSAVFGPLYNEVSGIARISVGYEPSWKTEPAVRLAERRPADFAQGVTLSGPHRDRYLFLCQTSSGSQTAGEFSVNASTGQRRLLALLLRIAQARCFTAFTGKTPVLLLDDVLLELDGEKRRRFLSVMPDYEQAFFTFLPEEPYKSYCNSGTLVYYVNAGTIHSG
jgi:DNA replication and repair protein RecF